MRKDAAAAGAKAGKDTSYVIDCLWRIKLGRLLRSRSFSMRGSRSGANPALSVILLWLPVRRARSPSQPTVPSLRDDIEDVSPVIFSKRRKISNAEAAKKVAYVNMNVKDAKVVNVDKEEDKEEYWLPPPPKSLIDSDKMLEEGEGVEYARIVREVLCELELPYILQNVGQGSRPVQLLFELLDHRSIILCKCLTLLILTRVWKLANTRRLYPTWSRRILPQAPSWK